jgi:hypothetical protein
MLEPMSEEHDRRVVERYADLPEDVRVWLERMAPQDVRTLTEGVHMIRSMLTVGRLMRWAVILLVGAVIGLVGLMEAMERLAHRFKGGA